MSGEKPLHDVKSEAVCRLLLDAVSRVNTRGCAGNTALMMAAFRLGGVCRLLLAARC